LSATHYSIHDHQAGASRGRRALSLALAVAIEVLLLLALLTIDLREPQKPVFKGGSIATFDVANVEQSKAASSNAKPVRAIKEIKHPKLPPLPPTITQRPLPIMEVSKEFLDAADISKLGSNAPGAGRLAQGSAPGDSEMVGTAPNGEPLYAAEWYREPTNQELATYMPKSREEDGWGMVACRTVERFHVEDCVELGQTPGSHLAGAVRQAAWQFLVRPPRVGGKSMVGEWVRIRIDYHVVKREGAAPAY
jgi:protein TonB